MFLASGMNDFVAKPIEIKELVAKIRKWLPEEKIKKGLAQAAPTEEKTEDVLDDFYMLDAERAVKALGSPELLRTIAEEYYQTGQENYDDIWNCYTNEDLKNYTIKVHALKSSSRQIGAFELGDRAEALEKAGKSNDWDYIRANTEEMLSVFRDLLDKLAPLFPDSADPGEELPMIPNQRLQELLEKLKTACDDLDMDSLEEIRDEFKTYSWPSSMSDDIGEICDAIERMEIITCEEILEKIESEV